MKRLSVISMAGQISLVLAVSLIFSCGKPDSPTVEPKPSNKSALTFSVNHHVDGAKILYDSIMFQNLSGNEYSISGLRYLISDIRLDNLNGNFTEIDEYHLIDLNNKSTWTFTIADSIQKGPYKAISYYIGFLEDENVNNGDYADLDEANWAFPPIIDGFQAGGYYTFELRGRYYPLGDTKPAAYSIKIGAKKKSISGPTTEFVPNELVGSLYGSDFVLNAGKAEIQLRFNVARIFSNTSGGNLIDLNDRASGYESDADATDRVSQNLIHAFSLGNIVYGNN